MRKLKFSILCLLLLLLCTGCSNATTDETSNPSLTDGMFQEQIDAISAQTEAKIAEAQTAYKHAADNAVVNSSKTEKAVFGVASFLSKTTGAFGDGLLGMTNIKQRQEDAEVVRNKAIADAKAWEAEQLQAIHDKEAEATQKVAEATDATQQSSGKNWISYIVIGIIIIAILFLLFTILGNRRSAVPMQRQVVMQQPRPTIHTEAPIETPVEPRANTRMMY